MASFLDKTPTFNPYVQQLPVEAMVSVGVEKQKLYDEGIQKIQTSIDNVAGLDVVRDVDKQYLQSKLDNLGGQLKTVAAGDFSNFQLTNSVAGMATRVAKDPNIINAMSSTKAYRKGVEDMTTFNKEGKGSPSNDWDFRNQAASWLNSKDLQTSFNGTYNPYTNYKKNALELIKGLTKSSVTEDMISTDEKGNMIVTDVLMRKTMAGVSPEQIQQALLSGLSPADFKQMEIDGRYNYSNVDAPTFINSVNSSYKEKYDAYTQQRTILVNAMDSTTDVMERANLEDNAKALDATIKGITSEYKSISNTFAQGDVESAKARLSTSDFIKGFSKAFSFTEASQTMENSPAAAIALQREIKNQDWAKFEAQWKQTEDHFNRSHELKEKAAGGGSGGGAYAGEKQAGFPEVTFEIIKKSVEDANAILATSEAEFLKKTGKDKVWLDQQEAGYNKGLDVKTYISDYFDARDEVKRGRDANVAMIADINDKALNTTGPDGKPLGDIYAKIPAGSPTITYYNYPERDIILSPREVVDLITKIERYGSIVSAPIGAGAMGSSIVYNEQAAKKGLSPSEFEIFKVIERSNANRSLPEDSQVADAIKFYKREVINPYQETIRAINKHIKEEVDKRVSKYQGMIYGIPASNPAQRDALGAYIVSIAKIADKQTGEIAGSDAFNTKVARKIAVDPSIKATIEVIEGSEFVPKMYEVNLVGKDDLSTSFRLNEKQKRAWMGNENFEASPEVRAFRPYKEQIAKTGRGSTSMADGQTTNENSYLKRKDFKNVSIYGVSGNIIETAKGGYSIRLNIYDPETDRWHEDIDYPGKLFTDRSIVDESKVVLFIRELNDARIYELIHGKAPELTDLKRVTAAKKPL